MGSSPRSRSPRARAGLSLVALSVAALSVAALSAPRPAYATAAEVFEIGPRTRALAGAGQSLALGAESAFKNPAALTLEPRMELTLGYSANRFALAAQRGSTPLSVPAQGSGDLLLGFVLPLHLARAPWLLGFHAQSPSDFIARAELPLGTSPQFPLLVPQSQALDFDLALGAELVPGLSLGAGLRALASLSGTVTVSPSAAETRTRASTTLTPRLAPILGALAVLGPNDAFALAFHGSLRADFDLLLSAADLGATTLPPLHITGVAAYDPLELALEYRHRLGELTLLAGLGYRRWSHFPDPLPATVRCPPERPACAALPAEHVSLHDTWQPHLALELGVLGRPSASAKLRAGYAFQRSPLPEQTGASSLLDADRHVIGLGYGLALDAPLPPIALDLGCELQELVARTHHKPGGETLSTHGFAESCALVLGVRLR